MCGSTFNVIINVNFNILLEQSNCALVGQIKRLGSIKNARYNYENLQIIMSVKVVHFIALLWTTFPIILNNLQYHNFSLLQDRHFTLYTTRSKKSLHFVQISGSKVAGRNMPLEKELANHIWNLTTTPLARFPIYNWVECSVTYSCYAEWSKAVCTLCERPWKKGRVNKF
jgi:hypothetical protein